MNLYEIAVEGLELERILEETGGELTPELEQRFDSLLQGKDKIDAALCVRRRLELEAGVCRQESERLRARAASLEGQKETLTRRVLIAIDCAFGGKLKTARFSAWGQNCAPVKEYRMTADADFAVFCDQYPQFSRVSRDLNKAALAAHIKDGGKLPPEIEVDEFPGKRILQVR
jgi:hypothetical protein